MNDRRAHWLRRNAANRMPRRVICLDTEAKQTRDQRRSEHRFRLACCTFDTLDADALPTAETVSFETDSLPTLWSTIVAFTSSQHRTVLFAHNLSYDLRLSNALEWLPSHGFECKGIALTNFSCWAQFRDAKRSLWLCDSLSFLPLSIEKLASIVGMEKPPLPEEDDPQERWFQRCRADVEVTRAAVLRLLHFLNQYDLGDFRTTGAGQASAAFRHRFLKPKTLLVHDNESALDAERRAAWAGRAEVWHHGDVQKRVFEYDYLYAYAQIAHDIEVPTRFLAGHGPIPRRRFERVMEVYAVVADVEVTTDVPCVPTRHDDGIVWPIGQFRTTLWDRELQLLAREGGSYKVERYWFYKRAPILREWARWIIACLEDQSGVIDPVARVMLKDWSRSLIGRFGLRYSMNDEIAQLKTPDLRLFGVHDYDTKEQLQYMQIGKQLFDRTAQQESPNSTPAVMSAIMAESRIRLWEGMKLAGFDNIYYLDTDGFIVSANGARNLDLAIRNDLLSGLRRKSSWQGGSFRAPRNIDLGETRRVTGAPRKSERLAHSTYRGEVWESLPAALRRYRPDRVFVHERTFEISDHDRRRVHLEDGSTAPIVLGRARRESQAS